MLKSLKGAKIKKEELLKECRRIFSNFSKDTIIDASDMQRVCLEIDKVLEEAKKSP